MIAVVSPAPMLAARALYAARAPAKPGPRAAHGALAMAHLAQADTYGFVDEAGALLAVVGFWPLSDGWNEVFTVSAGASRVGPRLGEIMRAGRLIVAARLHSGVVGMRAMVGHGTSPGARMAQLAGFRLSPAAAPHGFAIWELAHE